MARVKVTVTGYYEPDLEGDGYKGVEVDGETKDLTTLKEIAAYDEELVQNGSLDVMELLDSDYDVEFTVVDEPDEVVEQPTSNPFLEPPVEASEGHVASAGAEG